MNPSLPLNPTQLHSWRAQIFQSVGYQLLAQIAAVFTFICALEAGPFRVERAHLDSDLDQIVSVINQAYATQPFHREGAIRLNREELIQILTEPQNHFFLLLEENNLYGTLLLHRNELSLFAIAPEHQGRRVGSQLLIAAENEAFNTYSEVYLRVIPLFQERLIAYYEELGYRSSGEVEPLSPEKFVRIQPEYHDRAFALILRKRRSSL